MSESKKKQDSIKQETTLLTQRDDKFRRAKKRNRILWIAFASVCVIAILCVSYFTSPNYYRQVTAVEVGDHKLSAAQFNYYYQNAYSNIYSSLSDTYGDYIDYIIDKDTPLDEQQYSEDQTWEDLITENALSTIQQVYSVYDTAETAGYELSDDAMADYNDMVAQTEAAAKDADYTTEVYLMSIYGKGMNLKLYKSELLKAYTAQEYQDQAYASFTHTDDEREAYYENDTSAIDSVSFRVFTFKADATPTDDTADTSEDTASADTSSDVEIESYTYDEALADAQAMASSIATEQDFIDKSYENAPSDSKSSYEEDDATLSLYLKKSDLSNTDFQDWLFDAGRAYGDVTVIEAPDNNAVSVLMFINRIDNRYNLVSMRHILIKPTEDDDGNVTDTGWDDALSTIETLRDEWVSNGCTEDYFIGLANDNSDDGDGTTGGLYEDIYQGQMVSPINSWLFDESRQTGDYSIIKSVFGYHLVYFVGEGGDYWTKLVTDAMQTEDENNWITQITDGYEPTTVDSGMKYTR